MEDGRLLVDPETELVLKAATRLPCRRSAEVFGLLVIKSVKLNLKLFGTDASCGGVLLSEDLRPSADVALFCR